MKDNERISLRSETWQNEDTRYVTQRLLDRGFRCAGQLMEMRIYDLLNIYRINAEVCQEILLMLYRIFNHNGTVDEGMELKMIGQCFPFADWRKTHRDPAKVSVRDLVMAKDINQKAILRCYDRILKAFYKSGEYDSREYRYYSYGDVAGKRGGDAGAHPEAEESVGKWKRPEESETGDRSSE